MVRWASAITMAFMLVAGQIVAQVIISRGQDESVDKARKLQIIDSVTAKVNERYVFADVAKKMEANVRKQWKAGAYDTLSTMMPFIQKLSQDMYDISKDGHFRVMFDPNPQSEADTVTEEMIEQEKEQYRSQNYFFKSVEILDGNIGYIQFNQFVPAEWGGPTAAAALKFVENCDAVIIDLRQNGGGEPSMIQFISSYFFGQPTHLNSFAERGSDSIQQFWTSAYIPGTRMAKTPLYVLTSHRTFSGAEEFSYNMKNLKRATIVGEVTGGGAHPVAPYVFKELKVVVRIPYARAINPITGDNWEGKGVRPDIEVEASKALMTAHKDALRVLAEKATDPAQKLQLQWAADDLTAQENPVQLSGGELTGYVGTYGPRTISVENGQLYSQREGGPKLKIYPLTKDTFKFDGPAAMRIRFQRDASGSVTGMTAVFMDGHEEPFPRQTSTAKS